MTVPVDPDVSIILPVYNSGGHLRAAVERLLRQRDAAFEVVIVDDGSTDDTYELALEIARSTPAVRAYRLDSNSGVAAARELAVRESRGDYLWFVDDDDDWDDAAVHTLITAARETDADVVIAGARYVFPSPAPEKPVGAADLSGVFDAATAFRHFLSGRISGHLWNKLFRRSLVSGIEFTRAKVHSDQAMVAQLLARARSVTSITPVVYRYILRTGSIVRSGSRRSESLLMVGDVVARSARSMDPPLDQSPEFAYYYQRFVILSALKDATSGAYSTEEERALFASARRRIGWRGLRAVARRRDARRLVLLMAAQANRRLFRLIMTRPGARA